jgi:hypothetical protein
MRNSEKSTGTLRWLISCDESGVGGAKYYGFGSLWMKWQRRGDFARDFRDLCERHNYLGECKWNRAHSRRNQSFFFDLVEYFFSHPWLAFHCIIIRKGMVDKSLHGGDYDLARRKHFNMLLTTKIKHCIKSHPGREFTFRIWVDPIASRYRKADEAVKVIANNVLAQALGSVRPVDSVITRDSKATPTIQICDLLLGAVMDAWQQNSSSEVKAKLQQRIAHHLGWNDLQADTFPTERKFNIWYFYDPTLGPREVQTRDVNLKYPLP